MPEVPAEREHNLWAPVLPSKIPWTARGETFLRRNRAHPPGSYRNIPGSSSARRAGDSLVTQQFPIPASSRFLRSAFARELLISLAQRRPFPSSLAPSSVAFPPGAAHRSSTRSPGKQEDGWPVSWRWAPADNKARHNNRDVGKDCPPPHNKIRFLSREPVQEQRDRSGSSPSGSI